MKIPGFLFDNDGVLIDSRELHWLAWHRFSKEYDIPIDYQTFLEGFGKRNDNFLQDVSPDSSAKERADWAVQKEEIFRSAAKGNIELLPGMQHFLEQLSQHDYPRMIASSASVENLEMFLNSTVLGDYFTDYISAEQVPHGKPAPDIFLKAAQHLGLLAKDCIVLEDSPAGLEAAMAAGCFVIALATTHKKEFLTNYHYIVDSAKDLQLSTVLALYTEWR